MVVVVVVIEVIVVSRLLSHANWHRCSDYNCDYDYDNDNDNDNDSDIPAGTLHNIKRQAGWK